MAVPNPTTRISTQVDLRLDIDGSTYQLNSITNEAVSLGTLAAQGGTNYKIGYLNERPATASFSGGNAAPAIYGLTLVGAIGSIDANTKFFVDYDRAFILLHSTYGSSSVNVTYSGMGTLVRAKEINDCLAEIGQATVMALALG